MKETKHKGLEAIIFCMSLLVANWPMYPTLLGTTQNNRDKAIKDEKLSPSSSSSYPFIIAKTREFVLAQGFYKLTGFSQIITMNNWARK